MLKIQRTEPRAGDCDAGVSDVHLRFRTLDVFLSWTLSTVIIPHGCIVLDRGWEQGALWPATSLPSRRCFSNVPALAGKKLVLVCVAFGYKWVVPEVCGLVALPRGGPFAQPAVSKSLAR